MFPRFMIIDASLHFNLWMHIIICTKAADLCNSEYKYILCICTIKCDFETWFNTKKPNFMKSWFAFCIASNNMFVISKLTHWIRCPSTCTPTHVDYWTHKPKPKHIVDKWRNKKIFWMINKNYLLLSNPLLVTLGWQVGKKYKILAVTRIFGTSALYTSTETKLKELKLKKIAELIAILNVGADLKSFQMAVVNYL